MDRNASLPIRHARRALKPCRRNSTNRGSILCPAHNHPSQYELFRSLLLQSHHLHLLLRIVGWWRMRWRSILSITRTATFSHAPINSLDILVRERLGSTLGRLIYRRCIELVVRWWSWLVIVHAVRRSAGVVVGISGPLTIVWVCSSGNEPSVVCKRRKTSADSATGMHIGEDEEKADQYDKSDDYSIADCKSCLLSYQCSVSCC